MLTIGRYVKDKEEGEQMEQVENFYLFLFSPLFSPLPGEDQAGDEEQPPMFMMSLEVSFTCLLFGWIFFLFLFASPHIDRSFLPKMLFRLAP